uniref:Ubiquitin carboxyl-terminal hydrolase 7 n=1 Tax=Bursaphelenchus xylophilus TaxID=6326 RepID=A0A1I7SBQ3_BURXY
MLATKAKVYSDGEVDKKPVIQAVFEQFFDFSRVKKGANRMEEEFAPVKDKQPAGSAKNDEFDPEDRYKPEGTVILEIDRFSDFARGLPAENPQRLSEAVYIRGMPWKILAIPRDGSRSPNRQTGKCLGFFLQCNGEAGDGENWSCSASAMLRIVPMKEGIEPNIRRISHTFHPKENDWGYSQFVQCDQLLEESGGYIKDDVVRLEVDVSADAPHGVHWDSKRHAGYIGLRNQGATCYMNSILQTLFFTNKLRKAVYMMPTDEDDPESSVALAMQRVFFELQFSDTPVGTRKLTKSFGWDAVDSFLQHDVQELCRVLLDNLESKMSNTTVEGTIPKLFKGKMRSYVRCIDVSFESSREEFFYDVQLNVKGKANIIDSFRDYTESEVLDGDNMYDAGELGMQKAEKGVKFVAFPPVLHLQLMRFQYDPQQDANVKVNDRFEFPEVLQLNEFIDECGEQDDYTYLLQCVLVHAGDFHGGHYVVYINTNLRSQQPRWCKFDDDVVARCPIREAVQNNFGGDDQETGRSCSNAYMLVYVQKNKLDDVMCSVAEIDIPTHLKQRLENEKEEELVRRREREHATLFTDVIVVTDEHLTDHLGFDIGDYDAIKSCRMGAPIRVAKSSTARDFYKKVSSVISVPIDSFRLWRYDLVYGSKEEGYSNILESRRPRTYIPCPAENAPQQSPIFYDPKADNVYYIELGTNQIDPEKMTVLKTHLQPYNAETMVIAFLKFYNHHRRKITYHGSFLMDVERSVSNYLDVIKQKLHLPLSTNLNLYLEVSPDHIYQVHPNEELPIRSDRHLITDGIIFIAEDAGAITDSNNLPQAFQQMYGRMQVEAVCNTDFFATNLNQNTDVIYINIQTDASLSEFCEILGSRIDFDPKKIVLWRSTIPADRPGPIVGQEEFRRYTMQDVVGLNGNVIHDPRSSRPYTVYYSKIPILASKLEEHKHVRVGIMDQKYQTKEWSVFPPKEGTVADILEAAREYVEFAPNGSGQLRLVHVANNPSQSRVYQVVPNDTPINQLASKTMCHTLASHASSSNLRVEEIPTDQVQLAPNETLLAVAHYEKEPTKMFGTPFFIKLVDGEPFKELKKRVRQALEVSDRDFEKFKFTLVVGNRVMKELDQDEAPINAADVKGQNILITPYLGIDHANKSRPSRSLHAEKAIVIHN